MHNMHILLQDQMYSQTQNRSEPIIIKAYKFITANSHGAGAA